MLCLQKLAKGCERLTHVVDCSFGLHKYYQSKTAEKVAPVAGQVVLPLEGASVVFQVHFWK